MGMDITGKNPTSERGKYFGNNVHYWHPLADFCQQVAPEITSACRYWHSNDGHGLDAVASLALADALQAAIDSRRAAVFERRAAEAIEALPEVACPLCQGDGFFTREPGKPCWACGGDGVMVEALFDDRSFAPFTVENLRNFIAFLRDCGGFRIW